MRLRAAAGALLAGLLLAAPLGAQPRSDEGVEREARALFAQGNQLIQGGDYAGALERFQRAYDLYPSVKILLNIGTMLRQLGRNAEAADAYAAYLEDPSADAAKRAEVASLLAGLEAPLGKLRVVVEGGVASVRVDGRKVGRPGAVVVAHAEPGRHTVGAYREGAAPVVVEAMAVAGRETPVSLRLAPDGAPPGGSAAGAPAPGASSMSTQRILAATTTAVGAAGLVAGVALGLTARSQWNQVLSGCAVRAPSPMGCRPADAGLQGSAGKLADGSTAAFVIGGAAAAAAVVLWVTAPSAAKAPSALRVTPLMGSRGAAAVLEGSF